MKVEGLNALGKKYVLMSKIGKYALIKEEPKKAGWPTIKNSAVLKVNGAGLPGILLNSVKGDPLYVKSVVGKGNVFYASFGVNACTFI